VGAAAPGVDPKNPSQKSYGALTALANRTFTVGKGGETWVVSVRRVGARPRQQSPLPRLPAATVTAGRRVARAAKVSA